MMHPILIIISLLNYWLMRRLIRMVTMFYLVLEYYVSAPQLCRTRAMSCHPCRASDIRHHAEPHLQPLFHNLLNLTNIHCLYNPSFVSRHVRGHKQCIIDCFLGSISSSFKQPVYRVVVAHLNRHRARLVWMHRPGRLS